MICEHCLAEGVPDHHECPEKRAAAALEREEFLERANAELLGDDLEDALVAREFRREVLGEFLPPAPGPLDREDG